MNKGQLISEVAESTGLSKDVASLALDVILNTIQDTVANGEKVIIPNFGSFSSSVREAYTGTNPKTGKPLEIPSRRTVKFKVGKGFKDKVNK